LAVFVIGGLISALLNTWASVFAIVGAAILLFLGIQTSARNLKLLSSKTETEPSKVASGSVSKTFGTFVAATMVNPPTALYFLAIAPNVASLGYTVTPLNAAVFALSVLIGSLIWQESLVFAGLAVRGITTNRFRAWIGLVGGLLIITLAISMAARTL
jgi:threonine/homoserine/homoserine lactone efflux protein